MGKFGALLGSYFFGQLNKVSIAFTFCICSIFCCLGVVITWAWIDPPFQNLFFVTSNITRTSHIPLEDLEKEVQETNDPHPSSYSLQIENTKLYKNMDIGYMKKIHPQL